MKRLGLSLVILVILLSLTLVLGASKDLCTGEVGNNTWQKVIGKYFYCPGEDYPGNNPYKYCSAISPTKRTCTIIPEENLPQATISNNYKLRIISSTYISSQINYDFVPISLTEFRVNWNWKDSEMKDKLLLKDAEKDKEEKYLDSLKTEKLIKTCIIYKNSDLCSGGTYTKFNETHYHCNSENNYKQCDSLTTSKKTCRLSKVDSNCLEFSERTETEYFMNTKPKDLLVDLKELKKGLPVKLIDRVRVDEKNKTIIIKSKIKLNKETLDVSENSGSFIIDVGEAFIGEKFKIGFATTTISVTLPDNFKYINDQTPSFNFTISGDYSTYNATLLIDGVERGTEEVSNNTASGITCNTTLTSEGIYNWSIEAKWNATSVSNSTVMYFTLDVTDPVVTINYPLHNGRIRVFNPYINFTYSETYPEKVYFQLDGEPLNYTTSPYLVDNHTVLYLKMNEGIGNQTFDDSDYSNDGTIYGGNWTDGRLGRGIYFDGVDDYIEIDKSVIETNETTICFWEYTNSGNEGYFMSDSNNINNFYLRRASSGTTTVFRLGNFQSAEHSLSNSEWNFHVITLKDKVLKYFIDSNLKESNNYCSFDGLDNNLYIGNRQDLARDFSGIIDEVRILDVALSAEEVGEEYYRGLKTHYIRLSDRGYPDIDNSTMLLLTFDQTGLTSGSADGTTERDISGNNNDGAVNGCNYITGKFGGGMSFDGINDYVHCGSSSNLEAGIGDFTVEFWASSSTIADFVLATRAGSSSKGYDFIWGEGGNAGSLQFRLQGDSVKGTPKYTVSSGEWHHVIGVIDRTAETVELFTDGVSRGSTDITGIGNITNSQDLYLGKRGGTYFNGTIDQVTIYNRALSEEEIKYKYRLPNKIHNLTAHVEDLAGNLGSDTNKFSVDFASTSLDPVAYTLAGSTAIVLLSYYLYKRRRKRGRR